MEQTQNPTHQEEVLHEQQPAPVAAHDSNPFSTTLTGIRKLFTYDLHGLIALVIFTVVAGIILTVSLVAITFAGIVYAARHLDLSNLQTTSAFNDGVQRLSVSSLSDVSIYATWAIGVIILIVVGSLLNLMTIKLAVAASKREVIGFGELFKSGLRRLLPAFGLALLMFLAVALPWIGVALLSFVIGPIAIAVGLILCIFYLYVALRWFYSWFALMDGQGPVTALKTSWRLSHGHVAEIIGVLGAVATITFVPLALLSALSSAFQGAVAAIISLVVAVAMIGIAPITLAGLAERYTQLQALAVGKTRAGRTHILNYLSIIIYLAAVLICGAIFPARDLRTYNLEQYFQNQTPTPDTTQPDTTDPYHINNYFYNQLHSSDNSSNSPTYNLH